MATLTTEEIITTLKSGAANSSQTMLLGMLEHNIEKTKHCLNEVLWMARRYADGRMTYAPSMFNSAYDILNSIYNEIEKDDPDITLIDTNTYPYAKTNDSQTIEFLYKGKKDEEFNFRKLDREEIKQWVHWAEKQSNSQH